MEVHVSTAGGWVFGLVKIDNVGGFVNNIHFLILRLTNQHLSLSLSLFFRNTLWQKMQAWYVAQQGISHFLLQWAQGRIQTIYICLYNYF